MKEQFENFIFTEINYRQEGRGGNVIKGNHVNFIGKTMITVEDENDDGVKIILKKDEHETIKEIKFVCSCGETKSVVLDYSEE